jgi:hypothetical protein
MLYRLECRSSLTVAMTWPVYGSAVSPSHLPRMSHWATHVPPGVNSTTVLSRFPSVLACPCGPTPFWKAVNRFPPIMVMSSGWVSASSCGVLDPALVYQWCRFLPDRIWRTSYDGPAGRALAGKARATEPSTTEVTRPTVAKIFMARLVTALPATLRMSRTLHVGFCSFLAGGPSGQLTIA